MTIAYRGPDVAAGSIDATVLAPAILGTAALLRDGAAEVYGPDVQARVEVASDFRRGSFEYGFIVSLIDHRGLLFGPAFGGGLLSLDVVLRVLGIGDGHGLLQLLRWVSTHTPARFHKQKDGSRVDVGDASGNVFVTNIYTYNLYRSPSTLQHVHDAMSPLGQEGIEEVAMGLDDQVDTVARRDDLAAFLPPAFVREPLEDTEVDELFAVESRHVRRDQKWRLRNGDGQPLSLVVLDPQFWTRSRRLHGHTFALGDAVRLRVRHIVGRAPNGGLVVERRVVRFLEYLPAPPRAPLVGEDL